ncbi:unnamed protein product [Durusdinium trenchii]|uniref:J domain-containing protein n=1 Tax=Durusdinium trenchii TaxID=1381693 RepID=A0ABP0LRA7_9DINO
MPGPGLRHPRQRDWLNARYASEHSVRVVQLSFSMPVVVGFAGISFVLHAPRSFPSNLPHPVAPCAVSSFNRPPTRPPDPREDPAAWFAFFDEDGSGYLERQLLEKVLPAVVPVDASKLEASLRGSLWSEWDPAGEGRVSRKAFCAERGLLRWLAEHLEELQEEREKGPPPPLEQDREGWFRHWTSPGTNEMGKADVLRAVLKSCGTSSLEASAVAASREWIERCWLLWDRDKSGRISLKDFCADGGLADMMLQQSTLAAAKRVVRRMELEVHDPAALVACCQQLVECSVGIRPEDAVETWPGSACRRLREPSKLMLRRSVGRFCDLYAALGVRPSATHGELRDAYLRLAKQHHPDVTNSSDNGVRFQRVQRAWETLRDPQQRLVYDSSSFETGSMLRHAAAQRAASAAKKHASKNHWYEELRDAQRARTSQECEGVTVAMNHDMAADEMKWKEEVFPSTHDERLRMQAQQFEKVMREVKSHPDFGQFVGAGLQMKLLCQLGFILAAMLNLLLWAYVKQQKSVASSTKPPSGMDRALRSIGISLR